MSVLKYPHLFEPLIIGKTVFRNRIFASAQGSSYLTESELPTSDITVYYERKAIGGAAATCMGVRSVDPDHGLNWGDNKIPLNSHLGFSYFKYYTNAISRHGCVPSVELTHSGAYSIKSSDEGQTVYGPNDETIDGVRVAGMTEKEIEELIDRYVEAAKWAKTAGFGMINIHAGHGWLLSQFMSPLFNKRRDEWGGSLENRLRLPREICTAIHKKVPGLVVEMRMSGSEGAKDGYDIDTGIEIAKGLDGYPDIIHVSAGRATFDEAFIVTFPSMFMPDGMNVRYAAAIKPHIKYSKVGTVGALADPELMEEIIASGKADIVNLARGLTADPDLPNKARTGNEKDIDKCIRCFKCFSGLMATGQYSCAINPQIGREREYVTEPLHVIKPKKVLVLGGGIGGMQAALTASRRGHEVTLVEKTGRLGGVLLCEEKVPFKLHLHEYIENQIRRINESGVRVLLNKTLTPDDAERMKPDAIIAAIGSKPLVPPIEGIDGENVLDAEYAYLHPEALGERTVVLGGGLVGTELCLYLMSLGKGVEIVEMSEKLNCGDNSVHEMAINREIAEKGLVAHTNSRVVRITKEGVKCQTPEGEITYPADTVVRALGRVGLIEEAAAFSACAPLFAQIGDCLQVTNIYEANRLGFNAAMDLGTII